MSRRRPPALAWRLPMPHDTIELTTPIGRDWDPVVRLVLGGIADRLNLGFEELDDLQLAVERLLLEAGSQDSVTLAFDVSENGVRTRIGPLRARALAEALQGPPPPPGGGPPPGGWRAPPAPGAPGGGGGGGGRPAPRSWGSGPAATRVAA